MNEQNGIAPSIFLDWKRPWLASLADYLLTEWSLDFQKGDLSDTVVILPGSRAARRLLELLVLQTSADSVVLIPPRCVTLREATSILLKSRNPSLPEASPFISRLAWREAAVELSQQERSLIHAVAENIVSTYFSCDGAVDCIAERLAKELGSVGLDLQDVANRLESLCPEVADFEEPRWNALARLQYLYRKKLKGWGVIDVTDALRQRITQGVIKKEIRSLACFVSDYAPLFLPFFEKVQPAIAVVAPSTHAKGFDAYGKLDASYWRKHPVVIPSSMLVPCERSDDQAMAVVQNIVPILSSLDGQERSELLSIGILDPSALALVSEHLALAGIKTRWAGGNFFRGGILCRLMEALALFLEQAPQFSIEALHQFLRHPSFAVQFSDEETSRVIEQLDQWEREHLPQVVDKEHLRRFPKYQLLLSAVNRLEEFFDFSCKAERLNYWAMAMRVFLLRIMGHQRVSSQKAEDHYLLGCLEKLLQLLEEIETASSLLTISLRGSDFVNLLLEFLKQEEIPGTQQHDAIEMMGWLELAADDAPVLVITSCHEAALPSTVTADPWLSDRMRSTLGLANHQDLLGRDHYLLQTMIASREEGGAVILVAPRYNGRGEPVRPSRLLLQGCTNEELPQRVLSLTQKESQEEVFIERHLQDHKKVSSFQGLPLLSEAPKIEHLTVTSLRTYLQSPRLFYLQHILKLQEVQEVPSEMEAAQFGTLVHAVLAAFGVEEKICLTTDDNLIFQWLEEKLKHAMKQQFGRNYSSLLELQREEIVSTLEGFAKAQAHHRKQGWMIIHAEAGYSALLEKNIELSEGRSIILQGRIDRIDWHPILQRWLVIDYKTLHSQSWEQQTPDREHFQKTGDSVCWKDLQLPLYLKLIDQVPAVITSGHPMPTLANTDLVYFRLPIEVNHTGLSPFFSHAMIEPAWKEAQRVLEEILHGNFHERGEIDPQYYPTLAALCGYPFC